VADHQEDDVEVVEEEVELLVDADGTEYFIDDDGVRWEMAEDGFAYPAGQGPTEDADAVGDDQVDDAASEPAAGDTTSSDEPVWPSSMEPDRGDDDADAPGDDPDRTATLPAVTARTAPAPRPPTSPSGMMLELSDVRSGYGKLPVLHGVSFGIRAGETAVLLGLNGAGKTTTAKNVCGALSPWAGTITFDGQDATTWSTRQAVSNGIVMVPEGRRVFPDLSVERNLLVGSWSQRKNGDWFEHQRDQVFDYFPRLRERRQQLAGTLSGGEQQMLAIGRGLMANPRLLIIDEASMGLAPVIVQDVFEIVSQINEDGVTVLMIEQNVGALDVADMGLVMEQGHIIRELRGDELRDRGLISEILMG
jgi:branched-chain amino acid transport system ATP-binding protein